MGQDRERKINKYVTDDGRKPKRLIVESIGEKSTEKLVAKARPTTNIRFNDFFSCVYSISIERRVERRTRDTTWMCQEQMIRLLRHDNSVKTSRFRGRIFRSELHLLRTAQFEHVSVSCKGGGGIKKRFKCCVDPHSPETFLYLRAIQGHSEGAHINPTLQDNVLLPDDVAEHIYHVGSSRYALDHSIGIDSGWRRRQERVTCGVLYVREPDVRRSAQRSRVRPDESQNWSVQKTQENTPRHSVLV